MSLAGPHASVRNILSPFEQLPYRIGKPTRPSVQVLAEASALAASGQLTWDSYNNFAGAIIRLITNLNLMQY